MITLVLEYFRSFNEFGEDHSIHLNFPPFPDCYSQNNLLVRDSSRRIPFPSSDDSVLPSPNDVAFLFAPTDRDRVLVVDLGRMRRVREAGIELFPTPDVVFAEAVERYDRQRDRAFSLCCSWINYRLFEEEASNTYRTTLRFSM